jgi:single-strand DNA-binding protein
MANFNAVMVMGRLVADPELKYSTNGIPVCNLRVATSKKFKKADGVAGESTVFIDVSVWRHQAELCSQFLKKGRGVFVSGELVQSQWVDKAGQKRSKIRITADTVQFLGARPDSKEASEETPQEVEEEEAAE